MAGMGNVYSSIVDMEVDKGETQASLLRGHSLEGVVISHKIFSYFHCASLVLSVAVSHIMPDNCPSFSATSGFGC